jgi:hypothetical protein
MKSKALIKAGDQSQPHILRNSQKIRSHRRGSPDHKRKEAAPSYIIDRIIDTTVFVKPVRTQHLSIKGKTDTDMKAATWR